LSSVTVVLVLNIERAQFVHWLVLSSMKKHNSSDNYGSTPLVFCIQTETEDKKSYFLFTDFGSVLCRITEYVQKLFVCLYFQNKNIVNI